MRTMPLALSGHPMAESMIAEAGQNRGHQAACELPPGIFDLAIERLVGYCGALTHNERAFIDLAIDRYWTLRIIVDELRRGRDLPPVENGFNFIPFIDGLKAEVAAEAARTKEQP